MSTHHVAEFAADRDSRFEMQAIEDAAARCGGGYKPKVTFVVCAKRVRFTIMVAIIADIRRSTTCVSSQRARRMPTGPAISRQVYHYLFVLCKSHQAQGLVVDRDVCHPQVISLDTLCTTDIGGLKDTRLTSSCKRMLDCRAPLAPLTSESLHV